MLSFLFFFFIASLPPTPQEWVIKPDDVTAVRPARKTHSLLSGEAIKLVIAETQRGEAARRACEHNAAEQPGGVLAVQPADDIPNSG